GGQTISGSAVTLSGSIIDLNAALASLVYRGSLDYSGADVLHIHVSDGILDSFADVNITVLSAQEQATRLQGQIDALRGNVLTNGQANSFDVKLDLNDNAGDIGRVNAFLNQVQACRNAGIFTEALAEALAGAGNNLLLSLTRR